MPDPRAIAAAIQAALQVEREWLGKVPGAGDERNTAWMPFPLFAFTEMAAEALPEVDFPPDPAVPPVFLEIGAGPGPKMLVMQEVFGFRVRGFERTDEYAAYARGMGLDVETCDAADWADYAGADLIWFNKVYQDHAAQDRLEQRVWDGARPGAVVMCANLERRPPMSWYPILDDWADVRRGIWQKPGAPA